MEEQTNLHTKRNTEPVMSLENRWLKPRVADWRTATFSGDVMAGNEVEIERS